MTHHLIINSVYLVAAVLFIFGLKLMNHPSNAKKGNLVSALGMLIAIIATLSDNSIVNYYYILAALMMGSVVGILAAKKVQMTQMPEMVSLFNGVGGLASLGVGLGTVITNNNMPVFTLTVIVLTLLIGGVTFSGSLLAWGKLSERISGKPVTFKGQVLTNSSIILATILCGFLFIAEPQNSLYLYLIISFALFFGVLAVLPIGGADMPVVISLLNSYSGLAACTAGFVMHNNLLIVAGALVGASGIILTNIMCKAMNRSLINVLTSGFKPVSKNELVIDGQINSISPEDAYYVLEAAQSVVIIPGYGMAVAQAQHALKELQELMEENGAEVHYAIHPVAGRMPGHMNVLLAEADVAYDHLFEMVEINPRMESYDVAIVIGANDVVNTAARELKGSPIYGMPVINADQAKNVFVLKRGMATGFAGVDNPLFFKANCRMIFGDAKDSINHIIRNFND